jgi:hypothetical protein
LPEDTQASGDLLWWLRPRGGGTEAAEAAEAGSVRDPRMQAYGARVWEQHCRDAPNAGDVQYLGVVEVEDAMSSAQLIALLSGEVCQRRVCEIWSPPPLLDVRAEFLYFLQVDVRKSNWTHHEFGLGYILGGWVLPSTLRDRPLTRRSPETRHEGCGRNVPRLLGALSSELRKKAIWTVQESPQHVEGCTSASQEVTAGAEHPVEREEQQQQQQQQQQQEEEEEDGPMEREEAMAFALTAMERLRVRRRASQPTADASSSTQEEAVQEAMATVSTAATAPRLSVSIVSPSGAPPVGSGPDTRSVAEAVGPPSAASRAAATLVTPASSSSVSASSFSSRCSGSSSVDSGRGAPSYTAPACTATFAASSAASVASGGTGVTMTAVGALVFPSRRSRRDRRATPQVRTRAAADAVRLVRSLQQRYVLQAAVDVGDWGALSVVLYRDADANAVTMLAAALGRLVALVAAGRVPLLRVRGAAVEAAQAPTADRSASTAVPWLEASVLVGSPRGRQHVWQLQLYAEQRTQVR